MAAPEAAYYTPPGCIDLPYFYLFDASKLTDGTTPAPLITDITSDGDADFILRAVLGVNNCINSSGGGFTLFNYSGSQAFDSAYSPFANHYAVVPEKQYPRYSAIKFLLQNVLRANTPCTVSGKSLPIYYSQIAFQGVKRYQPGSSNYRPGSPGFPEVYDPSKYISRPYTYLKTLNLNWFAYTAAGLPQIPQTFTIEIQDYDFELHYIAVTNAVTGAPVATELFQIQMYDSTAKRQLSSGPVNIGYINNNRTAYTPCFPVPPVVYPVWTQIRCDITSLVCNSDGNSPYSLQLAFVGVNRTKRVGISPSATQTVLVSGAA